MEQTYKNFNNITFQENRSQSEVNARKEPSLDVTLAQMATVSEQSWDVAQLMHRWFLLDTFVWQQATPPLSVISSQYQIPNSLAANTFQSTLMSMLMYFRFNIVIRVMISGTRFHQGLARGCFHPLVQNSQNNVDYTLLSQVPNMVLKPDISEPIELVIPYSQVEQYYSRFKTIGTTYPFQLGTFQVWCFNQLRMATGASSSVNGSIYVSFQQAEGFIPVASTIVPHAHEQGAVDDIVDATASATTALMSLELGNAPQAFSESVNVVESAISAYKNITNGNFDEQNVYDTSTRMVRDIMSDPSLGVGEQNVIPLNITAKYQHLAPPHLFGSEVNETSIKSLCMRPGFVGRFNCNGGQTAGTRLFYSYITPTAAQNSLSTGNTSLTWLGHLSQYFSVWRGSILVGLEAVCTQFHVMKIVVAFSPGHNATLPNSLEEAVLSPHVVWDIRERHDVDVKCPYSVALPFLHCPTSFQFNSLSFPSGYQNCYSGILSVWVMNPINSPPDVVGDFDVNVYMSAANDIDFRKIRFTDLGMLNTTYVTPSVVASEQGREDGSNVNMHAEGQRIVVLGNESLQNNVMGALMGNETDDVVKVLRRYNSIIDNYVGTPSTNSVLYRIPITPICSNFGQPNTTPAYQVSLATMSSSYGLWTGSLNYKLILTSQIPFEMRVTHVHDKYSNWQFINQSQSDYTANSGRVAGYPQMITNTAINPCIEINVPWSQHNYVAFTDWNQTELQSFPYFTNTVNTNNNALSYFINGYIDVEVMCTGPVAAFKFQALQAAGPDFSLMFPITPPKFYNVSSFHGSLAPSKRRVCAIEGCSQPNGDNDNSTTEEMSENDNLKNVSDNTPEKGSGVGRL